ncbi:MAG: porin [Geobacteraceae bacterium]|nr:porin [Geobacteraceae bacterium]
MKKSIVWALGLVVAASLTVSKPCNAAFVIGGENGWQISTDGIVDVFATYNTTSPHPGGSHALSLLDNTGSDYNQRFGVDVGLLPSVVAFNIKAPTTNGIDSTVRIGIYPSLGNTGNASLAGSPGLSSSDRFSVGPNIDFREMFYTAKGAYGELLAGRALNLYQAKNILNDMTLLTAGTVGLRAHTVTLGHIGYGYLYTGFGPQFRYTTPDMAGVKVALAVGEPYDISGGDKTNSPRVEAEISYAKTYGSTSVQAWLSGLYQNATRSNAATTRPGASVDSIGGAYGLGVGIGGLNLLGSGYGGRGLGTVSVQDGTPKVAGLFGGSTDADGTGRLDWGFLLQATYQLTPSVKIGANYGQSRQEETELDTTTRTSAGAILVKRQESATVNAVYNLNKFTQFIAEYTYAQNTWHDSAKQHSNQFALGTMFYW